MKLLSKILTFIIIITMAVPFMAKADTLAKAVIRVEGLNGTIIQSEGQGNNALEIFKDVMDKNKIQYTIDEKGHYITSIADINSQKYGNSTGWMYYLKNATSIDAAPMVGLNDYVPKSGDNIILYFTDWTKTTDIVNSIKFVPEIVKINEQFSMKFEYNHFDYVLNKQVTDPIKGATVNIDNMEPVTTNEEGLINVQGLSKGVHTYKISMYKENAISSLVMDKGTFTIDGNSSPAFSYDDAAYSNNIKDNSNVQKNYDEKIAKAVENLKNISDPWVTLTFSKLNIESDKSFIKDYAQDIEKNGLKDYSNTEVEKMIIGVLASGYNPNNFNGNNLLQELKSRDIKTFLPNDAAFGLIALDYANASKEYDNLRNDYIQYLIKNAITADLNGKSIYGWTLFKDDKNLMVDPDTTGIVINALSPYYKTNSDVKVAVDKAALGISNMETENGYLKNKWGISSESLSVVIMGLVSVGINPEEGIFKKEKGDLVSALLSFEGENGMYKHDMNGKIDNIATDEALRALISMKEFKSSGLYNFYSPNKSKNYYDYKLLPKTGEAVDENILLYTGSILALFGLILIKRGCR